VLVNTRFFSRLELLVFGHLARKPWFIYRPIYMGFVVDEGALGQVFPQYFYSPFSESLH